MGRVQRLLNYFVQGTVARVTTAAVFAREAMSAINGDHLAANAFMHFAHLASKTESNSYSEVGW